MHDKQFPDLLFWQINQYQEIFKMSNFLWSTRPVTVHVCLWQDPRPDWRGSQVPEGWSVQVTSSGLCLPHSQQNPPSLDSCKIYYCARLQASQKGQRASILHSQITRYHQTVSRTCLEKCIAVSLCHPTSSSHSRAQVTPNSLCLEEGNLSCLSWL